MDYQQKNEVVLPEYGRNVQQMVEYCKSLADKEQRNRCARTIVATMANLKPALRGSQTLWDHLAMIAHFDLDIDWPTEPIHDNPLLSQPGQIPYSDARDLRRRHYGRLVMMMIDYAKTIQDEDERKAFALLTANRMKLNFMAWNKDSVTDQHILDDLKELSNGALDYQPDDLRLMNVRGGDINLRNDLPVKPQSRRRRRNRKNK